MAELQMPNLWDAAVKGGQAALQMQQGFQNDMSVPLAIGREQQFNKASDQSNFIRDFEIQNALQDKQRQEAMGNALVSGKINLMDTSPEGRQKTIQMVSQMGGYGNALQLLNAYEKSDQLQNQAAWRRSQIQLNEDKAAESSQKAQQQVIGNIARLTQGTFDSADASWDDDTKLNDGDESKTVAQTKERLLKVIDIGIAGHYNSLTEQQGQFFKDIVGA
jgi:hypothetical protein